MNTTDRRHIAEAIVAAGHRVDALGLVPARDGNISARIAADRVLVTRTFVRKRDLTVRDLVEVDLSGRVMGAGKASTELGMHLAVYRARPDVHGIVHAHPPVAVGFACAGLGLTECLMPEVAVALGGVPLTPYGTPGTPELENSIQHVVKTHDAFLLANHGAVTLGADVDQALDRMETLEHFAKVAMVTRMLGGNTPLDASQIAALQATRASQGDHRPITCTPGSPGPTHGSGCGCSPSASSGQNAAPSVDSARLAELVSEVVARVLGSAPRNS